MYTIHGFSMSSNTAKCIFVAEALGVDYEFVVLDLMQGEHKTAEHMQRHPLGKTPTLTHKGKHLFESGAICRYLGSVERSELYPVDNDYKRCQIDQWMDFFTIHLGRWLNTLAFERSAKQMFGMGEPDQALIKESLGFIETQMGMVNDHLSKNEFFLGSDLTIADFFALAYVENKTMGDLSLQPYASVQQWFDRLYALESVQQAHKKLGR